MSILGAKKDRSRKKADSARKSTISIYIGRVACLLKQQEPPLQALPQALVASRSVLPIAFVTVDRASLGRFEGNFALFSTIRTDDLSHLSGRSIIAASVSKTQFLVS